MTDRPGVAPRSVASVHPRGPFRFDDRRLRRIVVALLLVPLVVAGFVLIFVVGDDYMPIADYALMELKTRDVGQHAVLTGLYSRDGWSHPGPAQFYALAVPYRLAGGRAIGLPLGALAINALAIVGMVVIARRRGGVPLMLFTAVGCSLLVRSLGPDFVRDPWSPFLPVLLLGFLILLSWEMTCGTDWALPAAAAVASFCVQTHIGYAATAIPLVLWGAAWLFWLELRARRRDPQRRRNEWRRLQLCGALAVGVTALMWMPSLIEQLSRSPGNITKTIEWFGDAGEATGSLGDGYRVVAGQFTVVPDWLTGSVDLSFVGEPAVLFSTPIPLLLIPFALGGYVFWRQRNSEALRLVATLCLVFVLGIMSVTRTVGTLYEYRLRWLWVVAMLATVTTVWAAWTLIQPQWSRRATRALVPVALAVTLALSVANSVSAAQAGTPNTAFSPTPLAVLVREVLQGLPEGDGPVVIRHTTSAVSDYYAQGLILELERRGVPARVAADPGDRFGDHRIHPRDRPTRAVLTVTDGAALYDLTQRPDARLIAYAGAPPRALGRGLERQEDLDRALRMGAITFDEYRRRSDPSAQAVGVIMESGLGSFLPPEDDDAASLPAAGSRR